VIFFPIKNPSLLKHILVHSEKSKSNIVSNEIGLELQILIQSMDLEITEMQLLYEHRIIK